MTKPVEITGIHHVGLPVADFERALNFYTQVLGLEHIRAPKGFADRVRWLRLGEQHIHLIHHADPLAPNGPRHVALHIKDVEAARAHLKAQGVELDEQPFITNALRFTIRDPDGNAVELIQWLQPWGDGSNQ